MFFDVAYEPLQAATVPDTTAILHQLVFQRAHLAAVAAELEKWTVDQAPFRLALVDTPGCRLSMSVGARDDFISSAMKPVFAMEYDRGPRLRAAWAYVVDQTCIRIMLEELKFFLRGLP